MGESLNIRKSVFVKSLNCFDENLIAGIMYNYGQNYDDLCNSCELIDEREYFDFMHDLYKKVDELMEKENVQPNEWRLPDKEMPLRESQFIKVLARVDGDLLDKVLENMDYGVEDLYEAFYKPEERLYIKLMNELIDQVENIKKENTKSHYNPDYEEWKKDPENPIWKTID